MTEVTHGWEGGLYGPSPRREPGREALLPFVWRAVVTGLRPADDDGQNWGTKATTQNPLELQKLT